MKPMLFAIHGNWRIVGTLSVIRWEIQIAAGYVAGREVEAPAIHWEETTTGDYRADIAGTDQIGGQASVSGRESDGASLVERKPVDSGRRPVPIHRHGCRSLHRKPKRA